MDLAHLFVAALVCSTHRSYLRLGRKPRLRLDLHPAPYVLDSRIMRRYSSGQRGETVNLLAFGLRRFESLPGAQTKNCLAFCQAFLYLCAGEGSKSSRYEPLFLMRRNSELGQVLVMSVSELLADAEPTVRSCSEIFLEPKGEQEIS
jgi:hypothetical protein